MKAYPMELRERVMAAYDECASATAVAKRFSVHRQWIYQLLARRADTGSVGELPPSGRRDHAKLDASACTQLAKWLRDENDLTLSEIQERLLQQGICVSAPAIWYKLDAMGLTYKKNDARRRARATRRRNRTEALASDPVRNTLEEHGLS